MTEKVNVRSLLNMLLLFAALPCFAERPRETLRALAEREGVVVGAMIIDSAWETAEQRTVVTSEFNAATIGAYWKRTRPARRRFDWRVTDAAVAWCESVGLKVHLHPLVYASDDQNPAWLLQSDPPAARSILERHIRTAVERYRGKVEVWDVVNEAVAPSRWGGYRDCWWRRAMGPEYIVEAFRLARKYDPDVVLLYNETGIELDTSYNRGKWRTTQEILRRLHREQLLDGVGWQCHLTADEALGDDLALAERMQWVRDELGLANYITELDIAIGSGAAALERQRKAYRRIAEIWRAHHAGGWLQVWGVSDRHTWLGSDKRPLLFDERYLPKGAYWGLRAGITDEPTPGI